MILRAILGTLVIVFFLIPFIRRIQNERREGKKVNKWSIFFIVIAVVLWAAMMLSVIIYMT